MSAPDLTSFRAQIDALEWAPYVPHESLRAFEADATAPSSGVVRSRPAYWKRTLGTVARSGVTSVPPWETVED